MRPLLATALLALTLPFAAPANAAEIKVLIPGTFKHAVSELIPAFERQTGDTVVLVNDTAGGLVKRIEGGERFDVLVLTPTPLADFASKGKVASESVRPLARVAIGVAVKNGAAMPEIGNLDAFRRTLLAAPSVAYIDPKSGGSSGVYLDKLFTQMGIADAIRAKAVLVPGGFVAERVVSGEAAIGIHQNSEILAVKGATLVGPIPTEIQNYTSYSGGLAGGATSDSAKRFLALLSGEDAGRVFKESGLEPQAK